MSTKEEHGASNSGAVASRLALGGAQFGVNYGISNAAGQVKASVLRAILEFSSAVGIDLIDTAVNYGSSEQALGIAGVDNFYIVSKLPPLPERLGADDIKISEWVFSQCQGCLQRLRVGALYGLLLHRSSDLLGPAGAALQVALNELREQGLTRKIGVSVYDREELDRVLATCKIDIVQAPLNPLNRWFSAPELLVRLHSLGVEAHARSIFLQGLLLLPASRRPAYFRPWAQILSCWDEWLSATRQEAVGACLRFALSISNLSRIVIGVCAASELRQLLEASAAPFLPPPDVLECAEPGLINPVNWPDFPAPKGSA